MQIQAILFDLHHTLTGTKMTVQQLFREVAKANGLDMSSITETELQAAIAKSDEYFKEYQLNHNVGPEYGNDPKHWLEVDKIVYNELGFSDLDNKLILKIEREWMHATGQTEWEFLTQDARNALFELNSRGYVLGVCTRRTHDPMPLLEREGIASLLATVKWSGVLGYAKPSPFTLLQAADEIGINPRLIAYVGNYVGADVEASRRAEMLPVLLTWANPAEAEKAPESTIILKSPLDLLDIFRKPGQPINYRP